MIDNFDKIIPHLNFSDPDKFYFIQILRRRKDNNDEGKSVSHVKSYMINTLEYLESKREEIIKLCEIFNARAYIRLNRRSYKKVAFKTLIQLAAIIDNEQYVHVQRANLSAAGDGHSDSNKTWVLDIDKNEDGEYKYNVETIKTFINQIEPEGNKIIIELPTKNGIHLITKPFRVDVFREKISKEDLNIHKDNPTILYCN